MVTMTPMRTKPAPAAPTPAKAASSIKPVSLTIPIEGMSCASCVAKIEHGLSPVPGASRAAVNLATEQATIEYQPGVTDPAAIQETIRSLGYTPVMSESVSPPTLTLPLEGGGTSVALSLQG